MSDHLARPPRATEHNAPWGLYDAKDDCWLGTEDGPVQYDGVTVTFELGRVFEAVMNERLKTVGRIYLCAYSGGVMQYKDTIDTPLDTITALARLEGTATT